MRFSAAAIAFVATFQLYSMNNDCFVKAGDETLWNVALKKAAEQSAATPLEEMWKDVYDVAVRQKGARALRRLQYKLAGLARSDPHGLAKFLMEKLKMEVFGGRVNEKMWDTLTMELYYLLREWWKNTPENPIEAADMGSWQALVNMYKEVLAPAMRGSDRVSVMNELLLDPKLDMIRSWVSEWRGFPQTRRGPKVASRPAESASEAETSDS